MRDGSESDDVGGWLRTVQGEHLRDAAREHRSLVQQAFLDMALTPEGAALLAKVPMLKATIASQAEYTALAAWRLEKYYVKSGD
jgi:DNA-binding TFAR19-related protein (PDSD5 family)